MTTFADLGMPFPLFQAPVEDADVQERGTCSVCHAAANLRFTGACYSCFRAGNVDHTVDTEYGMVRAAEAKEGLTHGFPVDDPAEVADLDGEFKPDDPQWYRVRVPAEELRELLATPVYNTWQGERWLFCCSKACIFIGEFPYEALVEQAGDDEEVVTRMLAETFECAASEVGWLRRGIERDSICTYAFRCRTCERVRAHYDMD